MDEKAAPQTQTIEALVRTSTRWNFCCLGVFEFVYTAGLSFYIPMTVIPAYLMEQGASKTLMQAVMTVFMLMTVLQVWGPRISHRPDRKRRMVFLWSAGGAFWALYGLGALWVADRLSPPVLIAVFVGFAYASWSCNNLASPGYSEMMFLNIAKRRRGLFSSVLSLSIGLGGLLGALLVSALMARFPAPRNYHLAFVVGGTVVFLSTALLVAMHDHQAREYDHDRASEPLFRLIRRLWGDFNFRVFLLFFALFVAAQALAPLFIGYARDMLGAGASGSGVGYFALAFFAGTAVLGATIPLLADRFGFRIIGIVTALLFASGFLLPIVMPANLTGVYVAYAFYAAANILGMIVLANLGHEMIPDVPPSHIIALGRTIVMPVTMIVGPVSGMLVDLHGEGGYLAALVAGVLLNAIAALGFVFVIREPRTGEELYIRLRRV